VMMLSSRSADSWDGPPPARRPSAGAMPGRCGACLAVRITPAACFGNSTLLVLIIPVVVVITVAAAVIVAVVVVPVADRQFVSDHRVGRRRRELNIEVLVRQGGRVKHLDRDRLGCLMWAKGECPNAGEIVHAGDGCAVHGRELHGHGIVMVPG